eukprot:TRINITY_DN6586_c0_g1_i1.p1 TRINITY_DN6586_c0_g1~~TRINITY_DN6586_c0_g1_i1.p1  ORF type:complete len:400 (-),score=74.51 TRINITY_DN6586_c0_g1_i1:95-1294(-)
MGGICEKLRAVDYDAVFSYNTVKIVKIRDRRLGLLHYFFILLIIGYIFGFTIIYQQRYLTLEAPAGSLRLSLMKPTKPSPLATLEYCLQNNQTSFSFPNYKCVYWDDLLALYPRVERSGMFISTRVNKTRNNRRCDWSIDPNCNFYVNSSSSIFVADIERFTIMMDHTVYATSLDIQRNAQELSGQLLDKDGHQIFPSPPNQIGQQGKLDIIELGVMMNAAGVPSLDIPANVSNTRGGVNERIRYTGCVILVVIEYSNRVTYSTSNIQYKTSVKYVSNTEFKATEVIFSQNLDRSLEPREVLEYNRHGVRIIFIQTGLLGKFDFQVLLLSFVSGLGLLAVATLLVDVLATMVLKERQVYEKYKYQATVEYSSLMRGEGGVVTDDGNEQVNEEKEPLINN